MADRTDQWEDNIGGHIRVNGKRLSFYVDRECILCSVCSDAAPNNFRMSDDEDHDIVYKQPENEKSLSSVTRDGKLSVKPSEMTASQFLQDTEWVEPVLPRVLRRTFRLFSAKYQVCRVALVSGSTIHGV